MANYDHLRKQLTVDKAPRPYVFPLALGPDPKKRLTLHCVPAGTQNKELTNASLKRRAQQPRAGTLTAETLDDAMLAVAELYPEHVIRGWENVFDDEGKPVPYSVEECRKVLGIVQELAPDHLTEFASWAQELDNFRAAEAVAKN